jgi:type I restriction enzyme S subunit
MREGWKYNKIGEVMSVERGGSPRPIKNFLTDAPDGLNWIKISDATASTKYIYSTKEKIKKEGLKKTRLVNEGDFILSNSMSFGRPYIMKTKGCIHDGWLVLKNNHKIELDSDYLYHLLGSPYIFEQFDKLAAGSTVRNLNIALVSSVPIPIPPLLEQKQIVAILDKAFAAIDQAKANIERNIENAKELFQSKLNEIFSQKGEGWEEKKLGDVCEKLQYGTSSKSLPQGEVAVLRMGNIQDFEINWSNIKFTNDELEIKKYLLEKGDVLFNRTNSPELVGKSAIYNGNWKAIYAGYLINVKYNRNVLSGNFLNYYLNSSFTREYGFSVMSSSVNQANISASKLSNYRIYVPPLKTQVQIENNLNSIRAFQKKILNNYKSKLSCLKDLKKSLLQKAFSGDLTSPEGTEPVIDGIHPIET